MNCSLNCVSLFNFSLSRKDHSLIFSLLLASQYHNYLHQSSKISLNILIFIIQLTGLCLQASRRYTAHYQHEKQLLCPLYWTAPTNNSENLKDIIGSAFEIQSHFLFLLVSTC